MSEAIQSTAAAITNKPGLSELIRKFLLELNVPLTWISTKTGVPKTTLSGWLNGKKDITSSVLDRICTGFGIVAVRALGPESEFVPLLDSSKPFETELKSRMEELDKTIKEYSQEIGQLQAYLTHQQDEKDMLLMYIDKYKKLLEKEGSGQVKHE
jgi:transcriptional regulator with XRE-family HTH domain